MCAPSTGASPFWGTSGAHGAASALSESGCPAHLSGLAHPEAVPPSEVWQAELRGSRTDTSLPAGAGGKATSHADEPAPARRTALPEIGRITGVPGVSELGPAVRLAERSSRNR